MFSQKIEADDVPMLEATNKVLTSAWSEIIRGMLQNRITRSLMSRFQESTEVFESKKIGLPVDVTWNREYVMYSIHVAKNSKHLPDLSSRLKELNYQMKISRGSNVRTKTDARLISRCLERNFIILDVDKEAILTISSPDIRDTIELIYNPPCAVYPGGHFDAYIKGKVVDFSNKEFYFCVDDDNSRLSSAVFVTKSGKTVENWSLTNAVNKFIDEHPPDALTILTRDAYILKRGRALLRLDTNHPTKQMNQCEYVELDSSHLINCIEQALKSENVSQLAKVLAEYESESRSAEAKKLISSEHETVVMTSPVSRDACKLFMFGGSSVEADVYQKLVVDRINDGDITTTLKVCCISHQVSLSRHSNSLPVLDAQTLRYTFEQMWKVESYEQERYEFLSICDEWYRVLEPRGLMNIEQRELLREWISTRQYANTEDSVVSLVIEKCSKPKKERRRENGKKRR